MTLLLLALLACSGGAPKTTAPTTAAAPAPTLPETSTAVGLPSAPLYDVAVGLEDQDGQRVAFDVFRGHPTVFTMFYTSCSAACPLLIGKLQALEQQMSPATRDALRVLMVSFDPERDDPAALRAAAEEQHIDLSRWKLARPAPADVRMISALLSIKFNRLSDGDFNHSSVLVLADRDGVPVARLGSLADDPAAFLASAEALAATHP